MLLHEKLNSKEQSKAVHYMVKCTGWKLMLEYLEAKKISLTKMICLKKGMKNGAMHLLTETEVDQYRKEIADINWLISIPEGYINEATQDNPRTELEERDLDGILEDHNINVL